MPVLSRDRTGEWDHGTALQRLGLAAAEPAGPPAHSTVPPQAQAGRNINLTWGVHALLPAGLLS